ncbi:hypothetical protein AHAS_Ahas02G0152000 [Arachis hypogaea]
MKFATGMAFASPFSSLQHALNVASDVWCNKTNIHSWLIALNAHINIGEKPPFAHAFYTNALSSAIDSNLDICYLHSSLCTLLLNLISCNHLIIIYNYQFV